MQKNEPFQAKDSSVESTVGAKIVPRESSLPSGLKLVGDSMYVDTGRRGLFRAINDYLLDAFR
jgi:hypothetical protein